MSEEVREITTISGVRVELWRKGQIVVLDVRAQSDVSLIDGCIVLSLKNWKIFLESIATVGNALRDLGWIKRED
jgi:hypothetical protein